MTRSETAEESVWPIWTLNSVAERLAAEGSAAARTTAAAGRAATRATAALLLEAMAKAEERVGEVTAEVT